MFEKPIPHNPDEDLARFQLPTTDWQYVNIRRYLVSIEQSIDQGTQWAVFEPKGPDLWTRVRNTITDFLTSEWQAGRLLGATSDQAFYVRCDQTTMTQNDLDNGRLTCVIGVAPVKPAEFVVFNIAQWTAGHKP